MDAPRGFDETPGLENTDETQPCENPEKSPMERRPHTLSLREIAGWFNGYIDKT
jgi:hypothetical protein